VQPPGMRRSHSVRRERHGVRVTRNIVEGIFGWDFTDTANPTEVGIDAYVDVIGTDADPDLVTGRVLALQIKDGESYFKSTRTADGWRFNEDDNHEAYWLGHSLPVLLVLVNPEGQAWWAHISSDTATDFTQGFRVDVSASNVLDASAKQAWSDIAGTFRGVAEIVEDLYAQLPNDTVGCLRRATAVDRLAAARLAHRLVTGSVRPSEAVGVLLERAPTWIANSAGAQDLWLAVAAFATEHELDADLACAGFEAAAGSPGERAARARAYAGLTLLFTEQVERAREHLLAAREGGQVLLADFGLAALAVPSNTAPAVDVPESCQRPVKIDQASANES
jgi:hypothetical protein